MKRLKAWLRRWCAPDYEELERCYGLASAEISELRKLTLSGTRERDELRQTVQYWKTCHAEALKAREVMERLRMPKPVAGDFLPPGKDSAPPWELGDASAWRHFLQTPTGIRLRWQLAYWEQVGNRSAVLQRSAFESNCGYARGFYRCAEWLIHTLSADIRPQQDDDREASTGAAGLPDSHAPVNTHG